MTLSHGIPLISNDGTVNSNRSSRKPSGSVRNFESFSTHTCDSNHPISTSSSSASNPRKSKRISSAFDSPFRSSIAILILTISTLSTLLIQPVSSTPFPSSSSSSVLASSSSSSASFNKRDIITNQSMAIDGKVDFYPPINKSIFGQMLTAIPGPYAIGLGEPLNAILSARSDPQVLTPEGFLLWATSINFGVSCLGQANGTLQLASLGDGKINRTQGNGDGNNGVLRYNYGDPFIGTCQETFKGGNHFRWWIQNGSLANSGAYFLAVSAELPLAQNHLIMPDGYNKGRDEMVGNCTLKNGTTYGSHWFNTTVQWIDAGILLNATSDGINHAPEVAVDGKPAQDGRVALLTVKYLSGPRKSQKNSALGNSLDWSSLSLLLAFSLAILPLLLI